MDLVYILGSGSRWSDNEIRYSIRSAVANFAFRNIVVIGEKPEWMTNVIHVAIPDDERVKIANSIKKQVAAAKLRVLSNDYVLMNDDFFFLKPIDTLPVYYRGTTRDAINKHKQKSGYYFEAMMRSEKKLNMMGVYKTKDYSVHCPIVMNKENLLSMIAVLGPEAKTYLLRTCYGNIYDIGGEKVRDFKASDIRSFNDQLKRDADFLSINDALVAVPQFRKWIAEKYPEVSKYELDGGVGAFVAPGQSIKARTYFAKTKFSYDGKDFEKGQIIDIATMKKLKDNHRMNDMWELK